MENLADKTLNELRTFEAFRRAQETFGTGETPVSRKQTDLLNQLRVLIPSDFLGKNLNDPSAIAMLEQPYGMSKAGYLKQRAQDVWAMIDRVYGWYERHTNDIGDEANQPSFTIMKDYFDQIAENHHYLLKGTYTSSAADITTSKNSKTLMAVSEQPSKQTVAVAIPVIATAAVIGTMSMDRSGNNVTAPPARTSHVDHTPEDQSSPWCSPGNFTANNCCAITIHCCSFGVNILGSSAQEHHRAQGTAAHANGEATPWDFQSIATGETEGHLNAQMNEELYTCCGETFGYRLSDVCCIGYQADQGSAAAINGGERPDNCFAAMQYDLTNGNECLFNCLTQCLSDTNSFCCTLPGYVGSGCQALCDTSTFNYLNNQIEGFAKLICDAIKCCGGIPNLLSRGAEGLTELTKFIGDCFAGCADSCLTKECGELIALIGITASTIWASATGGKGDNSAGDEARRYLLGETKTSGEFLPSTIIMSVTITILGPKIAASFFRAVYDLQNGVAREQSMQRLAALCGGATCAIGMGFMGGASAMTFTTLLLTSMQISHELIYRHHKSLNGGMPNNSGLVISGDLPAWAYFSTTEWRAITDSTNGKDDPRLYKLGEKILAAVKQFKLAADRLHNSSTLMTCVSTAWPQVSKACVRSHYSEIVKEARQLPQEEAETAVSERTSNAGWTCI
jgi:hypothetical protein